MSESWSTAEGAIIEKHGTDDTRGVTTANSSFHTDMDFYLEDVKSSSPISIIERTQFQHLFQIESCADPERQECREKRPCRTESWGQYEFFDKSSSQNFDPNLANESLQPSRRESIDRYEDDQIDDLLLIFQMEL